MRNEGIPSAFDQPDNNHEEQFEWAEESSEQDKLRTKQLLGLDIQYDKLTVEELQQLLWSKERIEMFNNITAETLPSRAKAEQKRGIVSEIVRNQLIAKQVLKEYPTIYLGSGLDFGYPLAIGSRNIVMVDFAFSEEGYKNELVSRLAEIVGEYNFNEEGTLHFEFDFGAGVENVTITLSAHSYPSPGNDELISYYGEYKLPEQVGVIITFAPNSPYGTTQVSPEDLHKIVPGGAYIKDSQIIRVDPDTGKEITSLIGKKE